MRCSWMLTTIMVILNDWVKQYAANELKKAYRLRWV